MLRVSTMAGTNGVTTGCYNGYHGLLVFNGKMVSYLRFIVWLLPKVAADDTVTVAWLVGFTRENIDG